MACPLPRTMQGCGAQDLNCCVSEVENVSVCSGLCDNRTMATGLYLPISSHGPSSTHKLLTWLALRSYEICHASAS